MRTVSNILIFLLISNLVFGQKVNSVQSTVVYLPGAKSVKDLTRFPKKYAPKIDSLISLKTFTVRLDKDDLDLFVSLSEKTDFQGGKRFDLKPETLRKVIEEKEITLVFDEIEEYASKDLVELIGGVIDGAPFFFIVRTQNNKFEFDDNLVGPLMMRSIRGYLIFEEIYNDLNFFKNNNLVKEYFGRKKKIEGLIYVLSKVDEYREKNQNID